MSFRAQAAKLWQLFVLCYQSDEKALQEIVLLVAVTRNGSVYRSIPFHVILSRSGHLHHSRRIFKEEVVFADGVRSLEVKHVSLGIRNGDVT